MVKCDFPGWRFRFCEDCTIILMYTQESPFVLKITLLLIFIGYQLIIYFIKRDDQRYFLLKKSEITQIRIQFLSVIFLIFYTHNNNQCIFFKTNRVSSLAAIFIVTNFPLTIHSVSPNYQIQLCFTFATCNNNAKDFHQNIIT